MGVAKYLLQLGITSPRGKQCWSSATLHGLLSNPTYTGAVYVGRQRWRPACIRHSATHPIGKPASSRDRALCEEWTFVTAIPALVSQEDFDRVQAKLVLNQQRKLRQRILYLRAKLSRPSLVTGVAGADMPPRE
jgi:site-specific DNA recombinase